MAAEHHHEKSILEKLKIRTHVSDSDPRIYHHFDDKRSTQELLLPELTDILLWKNKKTAGAVLGGATAVYAAFELLDYHLLTLVSHILILVLTVSFLWAIGSHFINKSSSHIPKVHIPEDAFLRVACELRLRVNYGLIVLHNIALGKDLNKLLVVIAHLWVLSILRSYFSFVTLCYLAFVLLTVPVVYYDKYADKVNALPGTTMHAIKMLYTLFDANVLAKLPKGLQKYRMFF